RIKEHKFFEGVDWDDVYNKRTKPPIIPKVTHPADARNFDTYPPETTRLAPYTPGMRQLYEDCFRDF
ncbi:serine/threonine protein kinase, AGC, partial [Ascosphaera atra]